MGLKAQLAKLALPSGWPNYQIILVRKKAALPVMTQTPATTKKTFCCVQISQTFQRQHVKNNYKDIFSENTSNMKFVLNCLERGIAKREKIVEANSSTS